MSFLLDTNTCSAHLKGAPTVTSRFLQYLGRLHVSTITAGEMYTWTFRAKAAASLAAALQDLLRDVTIFNVDHDVARTFGQVRAQLLDQGRPIGTRDLFIAATALVHGLTVVTHNTKDFSPVPGLTVVDWLPP